MRVVVLLCVFAALCACTRAEKIFPAKYDFLGPFPSGTREQGADPLEAFGGIFDVPRADDTHYPSDLVNGGFTKWYTCDTDEDGECDIDFDANHIRFNIVNQTYSGVDWNIDMPYGWAGESYRGWAVGDVDIAAAGSYVLDCPGSSKVYVRKPGSHTRLPVRGDTYGLGYGLFSTSLDKGTYSLYIPVFGSGPGGPSWTCTLQLAEADTVIVLNDDTTPCVVDGVLASQFFSFVFLNTLEEDLYISYVNPLPNEVPFHTMFSAPYGSVRAHQAMPVSFLVGPEGTIPCPRNGNWDVSVEVGLFTKETSKVITFNHTLSAPCTQWPDAYWFTYPDFDSTFIVPNVQYAAVVPPKGNCSNFEGGCPIIYATHGAGVPAKRHAWTAAYQQQEEAWIFEPTNRRRFGFDWQGPGMLQGITAVEHFGKHLPGLHTDEMRELYKPNVYRRLYSGHSMGGHGCWVMSTHYPDYGVGTACAAGWISMELYFPYFLRMGPAHTDPTLRATLYSAITEWNTDLYAAHLAGSPVIARMGGQDDNVPPMHLRRMARIIAEHNGDPESVQVSEVPGKHHWWGNVVGGPVMQDFYSDVLELADFPRVPEDFEVVSMNPSSSHGNGGLQILQHHVLYVLARLYVNRNDATQYYVESQNVRRFGVDAERARNRNNGLLMQSIKIDGQVLPLVTLPDKAYCQMDGSDTWEVCDWPADGERTPELMGPTHRILERQLIFVYGAKADPRYKEQAVYMANDLYYQGRYSALVVSDEELDLDILSPRNMVLLGGPNQNTMTAMLADKFDGVSWGKNGVEFGVGSATFSLGVHAIQYLAPQPWDKKNEAMCVVIAGNSFDSFFMATELFPSKSSLTVPEIMVIGDEFASEGAGGVLLAGNWDNEWKLEQSTLYPRGRLVARHPTPTPTSTPTPTPTPAPKSDDDHKKRVIVGVVSALLGILVGAVAMYGVTRFRSRNHVRDGQTNFVSMHDRE